MSLSAVFQEDSEFSTIRLEGRINYETSLGLDTKIRTQIDSKNLIIDMTNTNLIGSSSLRKFYETLTKISMEKNIRIILTGIDPNFSKVFKLFQKGPRILEFERSEEIAKNLFKISH